jgi:hypothetical protein
MPKQNVMAELLHHGDTESTEKKNICGVEK